MSPPSSFFLGILLLSMFFLTINGGNLIYNTCKTCSKRNPELKLQFCTTSLQAAPASHCADLNGLGVISIRLIQYNLTDTRCFIKQMLKNHTFTKNLDRYVKGCWYACLDLYSLALMDIKEGMKSYKSKRYRDAIVQIDSVGEYATTCEDGFNEKKGVVSPLTKRNDATDQLSGIALTIMNILGSDSN